ncbi:hypothetical protein KR054_003811 [Drosophila jambulina]|nr:hypothetical protein KR054_003811 [Drosophila jambulina]
MRFILVALLISPLVQAHARTLVNSGSDNQKSNDVYRTHWPIDILKREVNYELMALVDERLERIYDENLQFEIRNFVVRHLRQCIGLSSFEESNCVMRATILYRQFA